MQVGQPKKVGNWAIDQISEEITNIGVVRNNGLSNSPLTFHCGHPSILLSGKGTCLTCVMASILDSLAARCGHVTGGKEGKSKGSDGEA